MTELTDFFKLVPSWALILIILVLWLCLQLFLATIVWFFKDYWNNGKGRVEKHEKALQENTIAIVKLQVQIERLADLLVIVPKIKSDVDFAHEKIREIQNSK